MKRDTVAKHLDAYITHMVRNDKTIRTLSVYADQLKELGKHPDFRRRADGAMFYRNYRVEVARD